MRDKVTILVPASVLSVSWPLVALAALLLFNLLFTEGFSRITIRDGHFYGSLVDILKLSSSLMLVSLGMTLVIATAGVDLSVGAVVAIAGSVAAKLITQQQAGLAAALAVTLGLCLMLGAWNGLLVAGIGVQPIVATLILMVAGRGIAQLLTNGQIIAVENPEFSFFAGGHFLGLPFPVTIVAAMLLMTVALTRGTAMGLFIESVGNNETASRYSGVNARAVKMFVYAFAGFCAGVAGLIGASDIKAADANNAGLY